MNNSEILILYEVKNANPNGDPANENRPRVDENGVVEVTDLRFKRFIRDYINQFVDGKDVAVKAIEDLTETNIASALKSYVKELREEISEWNSFSNEKKEKIFLEKFIDIPLFGLVTGSEGKENQEIAFLKSHYYGAVQFQYGYSLNKPQIKDIDISPITGTLGKDYRIDYGIFAVYGVINKKISERYGLVNSLSNDLDKWIVDAIPVISSQSRSKLGHDIMFYLRIEYKDNNIPKDLRDFISIDRVEGIKSAGDYTIDMNALVKYLKGKNEKIEKVVIYQNDKLSINGDFGELKLEKLEV